MRFAHHLCGTTHFNHSWHTLITMIKTNHFLYALVLISAQLHGMDSEIVRTIEAHKYEVLWRLYGQPGRKSTARFDWLPPGYIIKNEGYSRKEGAKILQDCVTAENLDLIKIPNLWRLPIVDDGRGYECCFSEYVEGTHEGELTAAQMRQCITLIKKAKRPYHDWKPENVVFIPNKENEKAKIALPDTEERGFEEHTMYGPVLYSLRNLWEGIARTDEAHEILVPEILNLRRSESNPILKRLWGEVGPFSEEAIWKKRPKVYAPDAPKYRNDS